MDAAQGVLANDTDPGNDLLTVSEYGTPSAGTLVGQADGSFVYTPPSDDFSGIVRFTYKAMDSDGAVSANAATVTIDSALERQHLRVRAHTIRDEQLRVLLRLAFPA